MNSIMKKLNISQVDTVFANGSYPIEFMLYYKNGLKTEKIRLALRELSSSFWPIFGEYDADVIHYEKYSERDCFDEEVNHDEFESDETNQNIYKQYRYSIPSDMTKLFFLKIIQFNNGTVLIPKLNHLAGDGYSYFYFLSVLAAMSKDYSVPFKKQIIRFMFKPHHRRTILREFQFRDNGLELLRTYTDLTIRFEQISRKSVQEKIESISANLDQKVSANDILSAIVLKKSIEIQTGQFKENIQLTIPMDVRRQIKEYGPKFFGNGLMINKINFDTAEIKQSAINEIAVKIRNSMFAVKKEIYIEFLKKLESIINNEQKEQLKSYPYDSDTGCLVTNLSKMPINKLNFGTGNPDFIFPLTIAKNSAAVLADKDNFILRLVY